MRMIKWCDVSHAKATFTMSPTYISYFSFIDKLIANLVSVNTFCKSGYFMLLGDVFKMDSCALKEKAIQETSGAGEGTR